ncbi:MAG TPA: HEAT repeat domain-containing protein [Terriglobales bacterium]|nr:HEAT repeat domain-containing protein [Terriglobales bacterium]
MAAALAVDAVPVVAQQNLAQPHVRNVVLLTDPMLEAWNVLQHGTASKKGSQRSDAIAALSSIGPNQRAVEMIVGLLHDPDAAVREKAVAALDNMQVHSAIPQLRAALHDPSTPVSFTAAKALWDMGDPSGRDILIGVLQGRRRGAPSAWKSQLQQTGEQLRSPWNVGLLGAEEAAGVFFGPAAVGVALAGQMLRDNGAPDRAFCAQMLGLDPSSQATAALVKAVHDKNWIVRASAAEGLGNISRPNVLTILAGLLKDPKPPVRFMAAASIIRLRTPAPAPGAQTQSADER